MAGFVTDLQELYQYAKKTARVMGLSDDLASDVVQETVIRVWQSKFGRRSPSFDLPRPVPTPYVNSVVRSAISDVVAHREEREVSATHLRREIDTFANPNRNVAIELQSAWVEEVFQQLTERQREVLELVVIQGLLPHEAASILQLSPNNVRVHLHRGLKRARDYLVSNGLMPELD